MTKDNAEACRPGPVWGDSSRDALIEQYLPLVKHVIRRMASSRSSGMLDMEDLLSYGTMGLIEAVDRYEPERGVPFISFATMRIRGAILDAHRQLDPLSRHVRRATKEVEHARERLSLDLGRTPTRKEIRAATGLSDREFRLAESAAGYATVSIDAAFDANGEGEERWLPLASEDEDIADTVERKVLIAELTEVVKKLPPRDLLVVSLRFKDGLTQTEIAEILGVSPSRVTQLLTRALAFLRVRLESAAA